MLFDLGFQRPKGLSDVIDFEVAPRRKRRLAVHELMETHGETRKRFDKLSRFWILSLFSSFYVSILHSSVSL